MAFHFYEGEPKAAPGVRQIEVPAGIESKRELLEFLAKAFPLPAYFGHNWDALEECLLDFGAGKEKVALIHRDVPLGASAALDEQEPETNKTPLINNSDKANRGVVCIGAISRRESIS